MGLIYIYWNQCGQDGFVLQCVIMNSVAECQAYMISLFKKNFPVEDIASALNDMQIADRHLTVPAVQINTAARIIAIVVNCLYQKI